MCIHLDNTGVEQTDRNGNAPAPCDLDLLILKVVSESRLTWATSVPISYRPVCSRLRGPMYATDRRQTRIIA